MARRACESIDPPDPGITAIVIFADREGHAMHALIAGDHNVREILQELVDEPDALEVPRAKAN